MASVRKLGRTAELMTEVVRISLGKPMDRQHAFSRGLSQHFIDDLKDGMLAPLLKATLQRNLDLQIRDEYINLYYQGLSALKLTRMGRGASYRAQIHVKYLKGIELPCERGRNDEYAEFDVTASFVDAYVPKLDVLTANANNHRTQEGDAEQILVRNSLTPDSPMTILDRQVQVHGIRKRADVIGITCEANPRLILGEVKVGLNNDIQSLPEQLAPYYALVADNDGRLAEKMACVYRNVVAQKRELGVLSPHVALPSERTSVECLAILCDYNRRSRLLDRAREQAKDHGFVIWVAQPTGPDYRVPDISMWERLSP